MNIQQLHYIIEVDRYKHFSKAAEACHVTQATLSAMIKKLEEELNVQIFDRKANPLITTDRGKEIIENAKRVVFEAKKLMEEAQSSKDKIEGKIKIGIIPTIANALLTKILKPIIKKYPRLVLEIYEITTDNIVDKLKNGDLDVGILSTPLEDDSIEEDILYYEALMVYGKLKKETRYLMPSDIVDYKIWMLEEGHCLSKQVIELCNLKRKEDLPDTLKMEANSFETLLNLVDEFGGLTLIPELYYNNMYEKRKQKVNFFQKPIPVREVSLVYYRPFAKARIIKALGEEIKSIMKRKLLSDNYHNKDLTIVKT